MAALAGGRLSRPAEVSTQYVPCWSRSSGLLVSIKQVVRVVWPGEGHQLIVAAFEKLVGVLPCFGVAEDRQRWVGRAFAGPSGPRPG